ncbi:hypothetical protein [Caballeronia sp. ATUFL_M2_KS44]|uniref:hypothetical protein n=1 Tax=Caballeronia sp. ATUFL_M2_KS44 TaxID=2921767 RepID=UPI00202828D4|nr:hypothetical protein [Caballeronia sp. ATUFL_M2_KS44]
MLEYSPFSILGIGIHIVIALCFAVHAVRSRQDTYWLYILFAFPLMGSLVYFFSIYLPELRFSRSAKVAGQTAVRVLDPNRGLREAHRGFDRAPTVENRMRLGNALLESGGAENVQKAREHFEYAAQGPFATEPALLFGLARAQFAEELYENARVTLTKMFEAHAQSRSEARPALLYAQTLAALNHRETRAAFEQAVRHCDDASARCRFAEWLMSQNGTGDRERARELFAEILHDSKHWTRFARAHNREWLKRAKLGLAQR